MVLSNSLGTTLAMWEPQVPALSEHFGVLRYDHPGHGEGRGDPPVQLRRGARARRARDPRRARASSASRSAGSRSAARSACGSRCTRPSASTASCWPAPPRASARARTGCSAPRPCAPCGVEAIADAVLALWFTPRTHRDRARARERLPRDDGLGRARGLRRLLRGARRLGAGRRAQRRSARRRSCSPAARIRPRRPRRARRSSERIPGARMSILAGAGPPRQPRAARGVHAAPARSSDDAARRWRSHEPGPDDERYERGMQVAPRGARRRARRCRGCAHDRLHGRLPGATSRATCGATSGAARASIAACAAPSR